ncbi:transmembrane 220 family protein [Mucilaginibacter sp. UR6-1]|uniref:transmembrane 220 family protein n=1 Tax=Mucilaginibacter sp. UR6-1 TaxID=1435643 RepID=UPI001E5F6F00|nr:transmembrane 220 family protein [Mucilaginibacter sp. UR6-1]MCC8408972.1 transmembrane 220 family protein [Mucilaginibacter sp. UR6-1]
MKLFNILFIILFVISAGLQYNDPDPYLWVPIYLYAALICFWAIKGRYYPAMYYVGLIGYVGYAIYKIFDSNGVIDWVTLHDEESLVQTMKATKPWVEEAREFFGLLICWAVLLINFIYFKRKQKTRYSF